MIYLSRKNYCLLAFASFLMATSVTGQAQEKTQTSAPINKVSAPAPEVTQPADGEMTVSPVDVANLDTNPFAVKPKKPLPSLQDLAIESAAELKETTKRLEEAIRENEAATRENEAATRENEAATRENDAATKRLADAKRLRAILEDPS